MAKEKVDLRFSVIDITRIYSIIINSFFKYISKIN